MATQSQGAGALAAVVPGSVHRAVAYMRADLARPVTNQALVSAAGVPERTLRAHFVEFLGLPPLAWLRAMRLAAAHEALLDPRPGETVAAVAERHGFAHPARFAAAYRARFGALPSATLERARLATAEASDGVASLRRPGPSLAVLALGVADGAGYEERGLAHALPEQLAAALSRLHGVVVRLAVGPRGNAGDARYLLDGSIQRVGDRQRIVLRLIDRMDGAHLWGDAFDGTTANTFALQDRAITATTEAIGSCIEGAEIQRAQRRAPAGLAARDLGLRAIPLVLAADPDSAGRALAWLGEAMDMDPDDAVAPALAGWCRVQRTMYWRVDDPARERVLVNRLAARAIALDPRDPLVLTAASGAAMAAHRFEEAGALVGRALAIDPRSGWTLERQAWAWCNSGEWRAALGLFTRAMRQKAPCLPVANCLAGIGAANFAAGRYEHAATHMRQAMALNPSAIWMNRVLLSACVLAGERGAAEAAARRLRGAYDSVTVTDVCMSLPKSPDATIRDILCDRIAQLGFPR